MKNTGQKIMNRFNLAVFSALISFGASTSTVHADDIEVYEAIIKAEQASGDKNSDPNVLFILDNSGSMRAFRLVREGPSEAVGPYDPSKIYGDASARNENFYLYTNESDPDDMRLVAAIQTQQNVCKAALDTFSANPAEPRHLDKFTQWNRLNQNPTYSYWSTRTLASNRSPNAKLECESDLGNHGESDAAPNKHPKFCPRRGFCRVPNGRPQYVNTPQNLRRGSWPYGYINNQHYLVTGNYHEYLLLKNRADAVVGNCTTNDQIVTDRANGIDYRCLRKLDIMKRALKKVVAGDPDDAADNGMQNINLGLMRFNYNSEERNSGGTLIDAIAQSDAHTIPGDTSSPTNKDDFLEKLENIRYELFTPLAESMYEAYLYFEGSTPESSETRARVAGQNVRDNSAINNRKFVSPRGTNQCQGNYVVMLSDGTPTRDTSYDDKIESLNGVGSCLGNCLDETAKALKDNLGVYTYTIGFDNDIRVLKDAARKGSPKDDAVDGDGYYLANDIDSLEQVFESILSEIQTVDNDSFVAPAVAVNAFNKLQSRTELYYALFKPDADPRWVGNLKKYKVSSKGQIVDSANPPINAISDETGFFVDEAQSFWSDSVDGPDVKAGGMSSKLPSKRKMFASLAANTDISYLGNTESAGNNGPVNFARLISGVDGTGAALGVDMELPGDVSAVSGGQFATKYDDLLANGTTGDKRLDNFLNIARWTLGEDIHNEVGSDTDYRTPNNYVGESLHSTPVAISYGDEDNPKDIVFSITNQGILHAVASQDEDDGGFSGKEGGEELWSYIPDTSLLKNLGGYYNQKLAGRADVKDHIYGLDGNITAQVKRNATDKSVVKARLFFGQRRGGNKYFALDVTEADSAPSNANSPVAKLWTAEGGAGDLSRLAQTWSTPIFSQIRCHNPGVNNCNGGKREVIVVSGGYDPQYDDETKTLEELSGNVLGNAIYILDAEDGDVIWVATNSANNSGSTQDKVIVGEMNHSIPADPVVLDMNGDGAIDTIFAIDIAGQVFRFDTRAVKNTGGVVSEAYSGGRIATLQEANVKRRFFNTLNITLLPNPNRFALVTGSGYRAHPLHTEAVANRYYVLYDRNLLRPKMESGSPNYDYVVGTGTSASHITMTNLPEVKTSYNSTTPITGPQLDPVNTHKHGYYMDLKDTTDEKVLNPSVIADFKVIGVTYKPDTEVNNSNSCSAAVGKSYVYQFNLLTGIARQRVLKKPGMAAAPSLIYVYDEDEKVSEPILLIGPKPFKRGPFAPRPGGSDPDPGGPSDPDPSDPDPNNDPDDEECSPENPALCPPEFGKALKKAWWEEDRRN